MLMIGGCGTRGKHITKLVHYCALMPLVLAASYDIHAGNNVFLSISTIGNRNATIQFSNFDVDLTSKVLPTP